MEFQEERQAKVEKIFKEIMPKNSLNWTEKYKLTNLKSSTNSKINMKKGAPRHITMQLLKINKSQNLPNSPGKEDITYRGKKIKPLLTSKNGSQKTKEKNF